MASVEMTPGKFTLLCHMNSYCLNEVTHIDESGFIYCTRHGVERRDWKRCRKLRPHELRRLERGQTVEHY